MRFYWDSTVQQMVDRKMAGQLRMDQIVVMAYRDTPDEIRALAVEELQYARTARARQLIVLGVESSCSVPESYVTFCQEGPTAMRQALQTLD